MERRRLAFARPGRNSRREATTGGLAKLLSNFCNYAKTRFKLGIVVALNGEEWARGLTYIQTVEGRRKYFHPFGINGWPKEPPNYIGFRYYGCLQRICHVEGAQVINNFHAHFPESPNEKEEWPYLLYDLGRPIFPQSVVRTGKIYASGRRWAMLDLLLTSKTIAAACKASKLREERI